MTVVKRSLQRKLQNQRVVQQSAAMSFVFSIAFLESAINSLSDALAYSLGGLDPKHKERYVVLHNAVGANIIDRMHIIEKHNLICAALDIEISSKGLRLYQDVTSLISIRNTLVHPRPVGFNSTKGKNLKLRSTRKVLEDLRSKFTLSGHDFNYYTWINIALNCEGAEWSIQASINYWNYLIGRVIKQCNVPGISKFPGLNTVDIEMARAGHLNIAMEALFEPEDNIA